MKPERNRINTLTTSTHAGNVNVSHIDTSPAMRRPTATRYVTPTNHRGISPILSQMAGGDVQDLRGPDGGGVHDVTGRTNTRCPGPGRTGRPAIPVLVIGKKLHNNVLFNPAMGGTACFESRRGGRLQLAA
jgi:hypothetical protein